jgi:hypothetical protein
MAYEDIAADVTIDNTTKIIDYVGTAHGAAGAGYYTGIYLHRWLGSLADDAQASTGSGDYMDMTKLTPSSRNGIDQIIQMLNGYTLTETLIEHLYDCSIIMNDGDDIYDGFTLIASEGCDLQIVQNGAVIANDFWNTIPDGETTKGLNRDLTKGIASRFLIKVRDAGTDIDLRRVLGQTRVFGYTYSEFLVNGSARGNNVIALNYALDNNNQTAIGTVAGWTGITIAAEGYTAIDVDANSTDEYYYIQGNVNKPTNSINDFYQRFKWLQRQASAETLFGLDGELFRGVTHQIAYTSLTGTFDDSNGVTFSNGSTAQVLADNGSTMWVQLLTGAPPVATNTISQTTPDSASATISTITERTLSFPACGQSTGSAILGGYGFGFQTDGDLTSNDKIVALDNITRSPPNNQTFYVNGVVDSEDYVLVGLKKTGVDDIESGQFNVSTALVGSDASVILKAGVETPGTGTKSAMDTPMTGTIRVLGDDGVFHRVTYTGYTSGSGIITFTGCSGAPVAAVDNDAYISYIDKLADSGAAPGDSTSESYQATYHSDRSLFGRVRDGQSTPIKTFEGSGTFGAAGGSISVLRQTDM